MDESKQWEFIYKVSEGTLRPPWIYDNIAGKRSAIRDWILNKLEGSINETQEMALLGAAHKLKLFPASLEMFYLMKNKEDVREKSHSGTNCPVCDRHVKVYKRAFNSNMATFLKSLIINSLKDTMVGGDGFIHHLSLIHI